MGSTLLLGVVYDTTLIFMLDECGDYMIDIPLDLEVADLDISEFEIADLRQVDGISYPCVLLGNIHIIDVLPLVNGIDMESNRRFPAWVNIGGDFEPIGSVSLTFDAIYLLKNLGVSVTLYEDEESVTALNLQNASTLERFI